MKKESFRIYLSSYDHKVLDDSAKRIIEAVEKSGASVAGPGQTAAVPPVHP